MIHHLALRTADVPRLCSFYERLFSFRATRRSDRSVWLRLEDGSILMIERREAGEPTPDPGSLELIAFRMTEDESVWRARLAEEAVPLEAATEFTLYFRDPDGRRIGVSRFPLESEGVASRASR